MEKKAQKGKPEKAKAPAKKPRRLITREGFALLVDRKTKEPFADILVEDDSGVATKWGDGYRQEWFDDDPGHVQMEAFLRAIAEERKFSIKWDKEAKKI